MGVVSAGVLAVLLLVAAVVCFLLGYEEWARLFLVADVAFVLGVAGTVNWTRWILQLHVAGGHCVICDQEVGEGDIKPADRDIKPDNVPVE